MSGETRGGLRPQRPRRGVWFGGGLLAALIAAGSGCAGPSATQGHAGAASEARLLCDACGQDASQGKRWPDGRPVCQSCAASAVLRSSQAQEARTWALETLRTLFGIELAAVPCRITLLDRPELLGLAGRDRHPDLRAFTEVEDTYHDELLVLREFRIYLLRGMPAVEAGAVLAHELFHIWQVKQGGGIHAQDAFREGAAQWVQLRALRHRGATAWAERLHRDPDPVYGEGLRRFERMVLSLGEPEALRLGATAEDFPSGF